MLRILLIACVVVLGLLHPRLQAADIDQFEPVIVQARGADSRVDYAALMRFGPWDDRNYALTLEDLALLSPDEAEQYDPIPAFFRVFLRASKPNLPRTGTAQYPRSALNDFRMRYGGCLVDGVVYPAYARTDTGWVYQRSSGVRAAEVEAKLLVGEVRVTTPVGAAETAIAISPIDANRVIAGSNGPGSGQRMWYSSNGGETWTQTPTLPGSSTCCDPTVGWSSDGVIAYASALASAPGCCKVTMYRSTDNGQTWSTPIDVTTAATSDKEFLHVDTYATSPFKDNVYVAWHDSNVQKFSRSTDRGLSYSAPLTIDAGTTGIGSDLTTDSAGNVYYFYPATGPRQIRVIKSTTGGASFGSAVIVSSTNGSFDWAIPAMETRRAWIYVAADTDLSGGPFQDSIYAAWTDTTGPESGVPANNHTQIIVARSRDGGATWNTAVAHETADALTVDRFNQWMKVDSVGRVHVVFYDTRNSVARTGADLYYSLSIDGGVTFSAPTRLTTVTSPNITDGFEWGDYNGLDWQLEHSLTIYTDNRDESGGTAESIDAYAVGGFTPPTGPSYTLSSGVGDATVCAGDPVPQRTITIGQFSGYTNPVTLSLPTLDSGVFPTSSFGTNPVTPPGTSTLDLDTAGGATAGTYPVLVRGTGDGPGPGDPPIVREGTFSVRVDTALTGVPTLTSPPADSNTVPPQALLQWDALAGAGSYDVEVAEDAAFATIVASATVTNPSYTVTPALDANTEYFWRVRAGNACGDSAFSAPFSFVTLNQFCSTTPLPVVGPAVTQDLVVPAGAGTVASLAVDLEATHAWVGDLVVSIAKVGGPSASMLDQPGSGNCNGDNVDALFVDSATVVGNNSCVSGNPAISGNVRPIQPFAPFDGQAMAGTWRLTVSDAFPSADPGTITRWCVNGPGSAGPTDALFANGFEDP